VTRDKSNNPPTNQSARQARDLAAAIYGSVMYGQWGPDDIRQAIRRAEVCCVAAGSVQTAHEFIEGGVLKVCHLTCAIHSPKSERFGSVPESQPAPSPEPLIACMAPVGSVDGPIGYCGNELPCESHGEPEPLPASASEGFCEGLREIGIEQLPCGKPAEWIVSGVKCCGDCAAGYFNDDEITLVEPLDKPSFGAAATRAIQEFDRLLYAAAYGREVDWSATHNAITTLIGSAPAPIPAGAAGEDRGHLALCSHPQKGRCVTATQDYRVGDVIERVPVIILNPGDEKVGKIADYAFHWRANLWVIALGYGSLYNHSDTPNAEYIRFFSANEMHIVAVEDIPAGREITLGYSDPKAEWGTCDATHAASPAEEPIPARAFSTSGVTMEDDMESETPSEEARRNARASIADLRRQLATSKEENERVAKLSIELFVENQKLKRQQADAYMHEPSPTMEGVTWKRAAMEYRGQAADKDHYITDLQRQLAEAKAENVWLQQRIRRIDKEVIFDFLLMARKREAELPKPPKSPFERAILDEFRARYGEPGTGS